MYRDCAAPNGAHSFSLVPPQLLAATTNTVASSLLHPPAPRTRIRENPIIPAAATRRGGAAVRGGEDEGSSGRKGETERDRAAKARSFPQRAWCFARGSMHINPPAHSVPSLHASLQ